MSHEYTIVVATRPDADPPEFMMVRHKDRGWELPGGKLDEGEGPVHCALREFREETGHLLAQPRFVVKLHRDNGTCFVFKGTLGPQVSKDQDEKIENKRWFERLPDEDLAFPDDPYDEIGAAVGVRFR